MNNVLITGANGQLGSEMHKLSMLNREANYHFTDVAELDITNLEAIREFMKQHEITHIVNCAAYTNVDKAEDEESIADLINHQAVRNLAMACKEKGAFLIHISTDYVFKGDKNTPCREDEPTDPQGVYARTKLSGERAIQEVGCSYIIFRTAWLYSSYGNNFVKTMRRLTAEKDSLNVVFDQVGTPTYAADLAALITKILAEKDITQHGIYHFSNEGVCSWYDFAIEIARISRNSCNIQPCHSDEFPSKVKRPHFSVLDKTKTKHDFQFVIPYWKDSLKRCIAELEEKN